MYPMKADICVSALQAVGKHIKSFKKLKSVQNIALNDEL